jgi:hypothetical protein
VDKSDFITYAELLVALENDIGDSNFKVAGDFLMNAVDDWPSLNLQEPAELITELKKEVGDKLTYDNLDKYSKHLQPDIDAWKMCAVTSLLEMFDFYRQNNFDKSVDLIVLVDRLTKHYKRE